MAKEVKSLVVRPIGKVYNITMLKIINMTK
mgnify:CR=1 FL=1